MHHHHATCKSCGAALVWIKTEAGRLMPCDPNLVTVVTEDGRTVRGRIPHWSTCPQADQHRKPREAKASVSAS
jgi:hypothetical protein